MRFGLDDIDPQIAQAMADRLGAPVNEFLREDIHWKGRLNFNWEFHTGGLKFKRKREPNEDERRAYELRKKREEHFGWWIAATSLVPQMLGFLFGAMLTVLGAPTAGLALGLLIGMVGVILGVRLTMRATPKAILRRIVSLEEMRAVFPLLSLTRAERVYCDALLLLNRMDTAPESEPMLQDTLNQLNSLVASSRQLETRRQSLLPILGTNSIPDLEAEYGELGRRLDKTTDPVSRQSLQHSLQMCSTRLENARTFEASLERLNTQQEAITQTISSVLSAVARMQTAPDLHADMTAQQISETVAQMNQQTYAVEQAVEEVMTLKTQ